MPTDPPPMTVTLLGTGTSTGVPVLNCTCRVCQSDDPRDTRMRCSCYIQVSGLGLLIDTGPDFRTQALREGITRIDAVCYTHHHFDHIAGLDDLRPFFFHNKQVMPGYAPASTVATLRQKHDYIFGDDPYVGAPHIELRDVAAPFVVSSRYDDGGPVRVQPIPAYHGDLLVYGYRIGAFAYLTDVSHLPDESIDQLQDLDVLVLDALRHRAHPTHLSFEEATALAQRTGAQQTYLIHMTHDALHAEVNAQLPAGINLGYDGLTFHVAS